jgi:Zn-dependent peptidase ImmA (M78 family)
MPSVNPHILIWARETAGLTLEGAVEKLDIHDARGVPAVERLAAIETGADAPTRALLVKMAKQYRRPLLTFYMSSPPRKGDRGQDYRTLPRDHSRQADVLLDALIRDVRARQGIVRSILEDDDDTEPLPFIGSAAIATDNVASLVRSIQQTMRVDLNAVRAQDSPESVFSLLRSSAESIGIFVLLIGDLGSYHTTIDVETFRGFAIADPIAPFVIINDRDAKSAWSFTLIHELAHLWLGTTGVSGTSSEQSIERFCNDVAGEFLLPASDIASLDVSRSTSFRTAVDRITEFANARHLSRAMVAYKLFRTGVVTQEEWSRFAGHFRAQWVSERADERERGRQSEGGPNYYIVRRHRLGLALLNFVRRTMSEGNLTPARAARVLGVKARNVEPLLRESSTASASRAV